MARHRDTTVDHNYTEEKWTKGDRELVERETGHDVSGYAKKENADLDRKAKLTRDERRFNETHPKTDRIKRRPVNSHTRDGNFRDAVNEHRKYVADNRHERYESASETGREWDNHQYIEKRKTKTGKIRYIYEDTASTGGNHAKRAKPITKNDLRYAKSEFNKGKEAISNAASQARDAVMETGHKIDKALNDAASTISRGTTPSVNPTASGSNYVSKQMSKSANIPVKDLFK